MSETKEFPTQHRSMCRWRNSAIPARSIIAIKGLPQGSWPYDETEWDLKADECTSFSP